VLTISGFDHYTAFRGAEAVAAEMATLAHMVPADGMVVVNADDDDLRRVIGDVRGRLVTFGLHPDADYRAVDIITGPQHTVTITCRHGGEEILLKTPFVGKQFHVPTLAAVAAAHGLGIAWPEIQDRLARFEPVFGRCSLVTVPDGPVFICDTTKAPVWSMASSVETLDAFASAPRRTLVLGTLSDYPGDSRRAYRNVWRHARERVDRAIFLRHTPSHVGASADEIAAGRTLFMDSVQAIAAHVRETAIPGEVILLKGSSLADHLDRIAHDATTPVACWIDKCGLNRNCINCEWMLDRTPIRLRPLKSLQHKLAGRQRIAG
jgi:UDP-N-acetylmuramoyl-tripeptide--D-alanyl-D-alanine ligase